MKILLVTDTFYPHANGSSYFCQRLSTMLKKRGHDVRIIAPGRSSHDERTTFHDVPVYGMRSYSLLSHGYRFTPPFFLQRSLERIIDDFSPDVIHCSSHFSPNTIALKIGKKRGIPVMANNHFTPENLIPYLHLPQFMTPLLRPLFWKSWERTYRAFETVVNPTHAAAEIIEDHTSVRKLTVISNGIDCTKFAPGPAPDALRERWSVDAAIPTILFVSRLDREKHVDVLIRAFARVLPSMNARLLIAGKGWDAPRLESIVTELHLEKNVSFLGFVADEDLPGLYRLADLFVMPSIAELQSIATLEALASGVPVVAASAMALPELVKDEQNGYVFAPDDVDDCATCILKVFASQEHRESLSTGARRSAEAHDIERSIDAFEMLYRRLQTDVVHSAL